MNTDLPPLVLIVGILSFVLFLAALITMPWIIGSLPRDVFLRGKEKEQSHPVVSILILIARNVMGLLFFTMGFVMLFMPGQGLLTMLAGLVLMRFPGKTRLVHRILSLSIIQKGLNGLRRRMGKETFLFPGEERPGKGS